ncbi:MAG TPA: FAD:protein FMN transferase [Mobilitalea sp.]|nr:FAD:protein FMN transferase [Mobilitalea sp.]
MRRIIASLLMIVVFLNMSGCSKKEATRYEATFLELFDTVTTIVGFGKSEEDFSTFAQAVHDDLEEYHKLYDIYNDYKGINNIKTINDNAGISPVKVDVRIIDLLDFSKKAAEITGGEINIAYGAVLRVWHDYRTEGIDDPENSKLPPMELLQEKSEHTDINKLIIDRNSGTVFLEDPEMSLDVGAIAKGYATEMVARDMVTKGYQNAMLSVGGNVCTIGNKPDGEAWNVGIQNPDMESEQSNLYVLRLKDYSLVTSGDYQRYYTVEGMRYHHIIDPDTLMPASYYTAVSIICRDSGMADALSTSVFNMPYEQGLALVEGLEDTEALWVFKDGSMKHSSAFNQFFPIE